MTARGSMTVTTGGLFLLGAAAPAQASDFSGMIPFFIGGFLIGLALTCAVAWGITYFIPDKTIKWMVRGLAIVGYLLFAFFALFGF
jgi:hypothetical protein